MKKLLIRKSEEVVTCSNNLLSEKDQIRTTYEPNQPDDGVNACRMNFLLN